MTCPRSYQIGTHCYIKKKISVFFLISEVCHGFSPGPPNPKSSPGPSAPLLGTSQAKGRRGQQSPRAQPSREGFQSTERSMVFALITNLPCSSNGKESACSAGDQGSIPGLARSSGEGNNNPLQYSCLENPMDRRARRATVCGVTKSQTRLGD